jgi:hypothetical protein
VKLKLIRFFDLRFLTCRREGNAGAPLILNITVIDTNTCQPIVGAAVDIWHCNSLGVYSGFLAEGTKNETFLRGIQFTDDNGIASFTTIYPGWYTGRVTHIHIKVHINSTLDSPSGTIVGGHVSHTGQIYFNDTIDSEIAKLEPYSQRASVPLTTQNSDSIFVNQGGIESLLDLQFIDPEVEYIGGFVASIVLGVESASGSPQAAPQAAPQASQVPQASPVTSGTPNIQTPSAKQSGSALLLGVTNWVLLAAIVVAMN